MSRTTVTLTIAGVAAVAAAMGCAAGVLLAPASGRETRRRLSRRLADEGDHLRRAGEFAISKPVRETLFTVVPREEKYKSKNFIDTVVFRGGDAVSGWLFEGLRILGLGFAGIAFVGVPIALIWAGTGWMLGRAQEDMRKTQDWRRRTDAPETDHTSAPRNSAGTGGMGSVGGDGQPVIR